MKTDIRVERIHLLIVLFSEVDDTVLAEIGIRIAGLGVHRDELVADRYIEDAFVCAVCPIGHSVSRSSAGSATVALILLMMPEEFTGGCFESNHGAPRASGQ